MSGRVTVANVDSYVPMPQSAVRVVGAVAAMCGRVLAIGALPLRVSPVLASIAVGSVLTDGRHGALASPPSGVR